MLKNKMQYLNSAGKHIGIGNTAHKNIAFTLISGNKGSRRHDNYVGFKDRLADRSAKSSVSLVAPTADY